MRQRPRSAPRSRARMLRDAERPSALCLTAASGLGLGRRPAEDALRWFTKQASSSSVPFNDKAHRATYRWSVGHGNYQTKGERPVVDS
jgi:hypothetical protein